MYYLMHTNYAFKLKCIFSRFHNLSIFLFPSVMVAYILSPAFIQGRLSLIVFLLMKIYFSYSAWSYLNIYVFHRLCWQNTLKVLNIDLGVVNFWHLELKKVSILSNFWRRERERQLRRSAWLSFLILNMHPPSKFQEKNLISSNLKLLIWFLSNYG